MCCVRPMQSKVSRLWSTRSSSNPARSKNLGRHIVPEAHNLLDQYLRCEVAAEDPDLQDLFALYLKHWQKGTHAGQNDKKEKETLAEEDCGQEEDGEEETLEDDVCIDDDGYECLPDLELGQRLGAIPGLETKAPQKDPEKDPCPVAATPTSSTEPQLDGIPTQAEATSMRQVSEATAPELKKKEAFIPTATSDEIAARGERLARIALLRLFVSSCSRALAYIYIYNSP